MCIVSVGVSLFADPHALSFCFYEGYFVLFTLTIKILTGKSDTPSKQPNLLLATWNLQEACDTSENQILLYQKSVQFIK